MIEGRLMQRQLERASAIWGCQINDVRYGHAPPPADMRRAQPFFGEHSFAFLVGRVGLEPTTFEMTIVSAFVRLPKNRL
jgi:hypothetical protein